MRKINVMFYTPPHTDSFLNRAVSWYDPPYSHVELSFEDGHACSIFNGESVFMQQRSYANPNYDVLTIGVSHDSYLKVLTFCKKLHKQKVGFDSWGMFSSVIPFCSQSPRHDATFCSRLVTEALQQASLAALEGENSVKMTPSRLHRLIKVVPDTMLDTVPARCMRLK